MVGTYPVSVLVIGGSYIFLDLARDFFVGFSRGIGEYTAQSLAKPVDLSGEETGECNCSLLEGQIVELEVRQCFGWTELFVALLLGILLGIFVGVRLLRPRQVIGRPVV